MSAPPQNEASPTTEPAPHSSTSTRDFDPVHDGYANVPGPDGFDSAEDQAGFQIELARLEREQVVEEPALEERQVWPAPGNPVK